ncbi:M23 family metallopeptidase [Deinococcus sp. KSM4-11]|uniref:M23 family metallopeptidase n=1 Tax=Deinococcus sp. KSM4-11 TaxID=2568654 RepID=UPI001454C99A|nr:M23 family metallopeptidase [Deinococcus sp. KSM4-11]
MSKLPPSAGGTPTPPKQNTGPTPTPTPTPATPAAPGLFWPVDLSRVTIGPRFLGHYAHGTWQQNPLAGYRAGYGYHTGVDFLRPHLPGLAVFSIADGVVVSSTSRSAPGYGNNVVISHPALGVYTRYSHLDSRAVSEGAGVKAGQMIGRMGESGTDNVHLHFDVIQQGLPTPRFNPHNPLTGGVAHPLPGLDPIEEALTVQYFRNPLAFLNAKTAANPVNLKVATV